MSEESRTPDPGAPTADDRATGAGPEATADVVTPEVENTAGGPVDLDADAPADGGQGGDGAEAELARAREEIAGLRDQALRAQAEMENVRRRAARDVEAAHKFALEKFAKSLLPVADSVEKSVEAARAEGDERFAPIREGIELSGRLLFETLGKYDIEVIDPHGEPFDPERHEAMSMIEAPSAEPNSVVDVLQKGYVLNGRLLRAAMVIVARGK